MSFRIVFHIYICIHIYLKGLYPDSCERQGVKGSGLIEKIERCQNNVDDRARARQRGFSGSGLGLSHKGCA